MAKKVTVDTSVENTTTLPEGTTAPEATTTAPEATTQEVPTDTSNEPTENTTTTTSTEESSIEQPATITGDEVFNVDNLSEEAKSNLESVDIIGQLHEAERIQNLSPEEYELEFGFTINDAINVIREKIKGTFHEDRIQSMLEKIEELINLK